MPISGVSTDVLAMIEDQTAEILTAREAAVELEIFILGQYRRGHISRDKIADLLMHADNVRIGIKRGHDFAKKVRGHPEIY